MVEIKPIDLCELIKPSDGFDLVKGEDKSLDVRELIKESHIFQVVIEEIAVFHILQLILPADRLHLIIRLHSLEFDPIGDLRSNRVLNPFLSLFVEV